MSTTEYRSYLPNSKAMAFLFKILIQMHPLSIDRAIWIYAFVINNHSLASPLFQAPTTQRQNSFLTSSDTFGHSQIYIMQFDVVMQPTFRFEHMKNITCTSLDLSNSIPSNTVLVGPLPAWPGFLTWWILINNEFTVFLQPRFVSCNTCLIFLHTQTESDTYGLIVLKNNMNG